MKTANPYSVKDVNAKQGPTTGNTGDVAKRKSFKAAKESMAPVAKAINKAYGDRAQVDYVDSKLEPVGSTVRGKKFSSK
jgi:hypothetical protein